MYDSNNSAIVLLKRFSLCFCIAEDATTLKLEGDLNAEETSSEDEDELTQERHGLQDVWDEDENEDEDEQEGDDDDEDEDEDSNEDEHKQEGDDDDEDEDSKEDEYSTSMRATMTGMK